MQQEVQLSGEQEGHVVKELLHTVKYGLEVAMRAPADYGGSRFNECVCPQGSQASDSLYRMCTIETAPAVLTLQLLRFSCDKNGVTSKFQHTVGCLFRLAAAAGKSAVLLALTHWLHRNLLDIPVLCRYTLHLYWIWRPTNGTRSSLDCGHYVAYIKEGRL